MSNYSCTTDVKPGTAPENAKAHHIKDKSGQTVYFENPFPSYGWKDVSLLKAGYIFFCYRAQGKLPVPNTSNAQIPTVPFPSGLRALFDPVFEERFSSIGPKRFTQAACKPEDFPVLDAVFISHNHPDHLSYTTVKEIVRVFPRVHFFVGLNAAKWFHDSGFYAVTEMDWLDDAEVILDRATASSKVDSDEIKLERISARVSCLPSQHGSMRTPLDKDRSLWASWAVTSGAKDWELTRTVRPGADSDWGISSTLYVQPSTRQPYDAVEIFQDTKCKKALGIHWGTWALTSEPVEEPPKTLKEALKIKGLPQKGVFDTWAIGESREF